MLELCLNSLAVLTGGQRLEVLIVDNNSSDDTPAVARRFTERYANFRYVKELAQGLSHARNRGVREAHAPFVAYIDDDARALPGWGEAILACFARHPEADAVGGPYEAFSTAPIPAWFPKEYGTKNIEGGEHVLKDGEWLSGTNMIFRKSCLGKIGGFDTGIGMRGDRVSYGEETNLLLRMKQQGSVIYYDPSIVVQHAILPFKLSLGWLLKASFANGYDGVKTFEYKGGAFTYFPLLTKGFASALVRFIFCKERYIKARIYRSLAPWLWQVGFFKRLAGF